MNRDRALLAASGVGALLLGAAFASGGGGAVESLAQRLGSDYLLVAGLGGLAVVVAAPVLASGRAAKLRQFEMPAPERPTSAAPAGSGFDAACERWRVQVPVYGAEERERLRGRLLEAAVETERRRADCGRDEALERVRSGEWGDDGAAATFLADGRPTLSVSARALAAGEPPFGRAARRTAREIVRRNREDGTMPDAPEHGTRRQSTGGRGATDGGRAR